MITPDEFFKLMTPSPAPRPETLTAIAMHIDAHISAAARKLPRQGSIIVQPMPGSDWTEAEVATVLDKYRTAGWEVHPMVTALCALSVRTTRG